MWTIRAGRGAEHVEAFLKHGLVAVDAGPSLLGQKSLEEVRRWWRAEHPEDSPNKIGAHAGQAHRYANVMRVGDEVLVFDPASRDYHVGTVTGECRHAPGVVGEADEMAVVRDVDWTSRVGRDGLSASTRNSLGSISTIFQPSDEARDEIRAALRGDRPAAAATTSTSDDGAAEEQAELSEIREDVAARSEELIKDLIARLDWSEMQDLVAAVLRAMGYKTRVSSPGRDRGTDVIASPDGLGLEPPRIKAEVKHRKGTMGAPEVRGFLGGLRKEDRGLYVSTGGFTQEARYEAERAEVPVALVDLAGLAELVVQHYEAMDGDGRALVPLQRLYWPVR